MIKKNTKIIFEGEENPTEIIGGMPLSKGEIIHLHNEKGETIDYEVGEKIIDLFMKGEDQIINITYTLRKK